MYWTAHTPEGDATLCETCALLAYNMAAFPFVRRPFTDMQTALDWLHDQERAAGIVPTDGLTSSPYGMCGHCGEDEYEPVSA